VAARDERLIKEAEDSDLPAVLAAVGLREPDDVRFLPSGLMNLNWRVVAGSHAVAVKRILDVDPATARRNLSVLEFLADASIPVCVPLTTNSGEAVVELAERAYCVLPWVDGAQSHGTDLTVGQAVELGALLGCIHTALGPATVKASFDMTADVRSSVRQPEDAVGEADRFLGIIEEMGTSTSFDREAAAFLRRRKTLLATHADARPTSPIPASPVGPTHGDFQHFNLIWREGTVAAVLD
jgi:homoserine kinase type II